MATEAMRHHGKPAKLHNRDYDCFDCEQLVNVVYKEVLGISVRTNGFGKSTTTKVYTSTIGKVYSINEKNKIDKLEELQKGDILFFHTQSKKEQYPTKNNRYPGHIAIYLGDYKFIHAKTSAGIVGINSLREKKYYKKWVGYKNIVDFISKKTLKKV